MNPPKCVAPLVALLAFTLTHLASAMGATPGAGITAAQPSGTISGRVSNAATHANLEGASIRIEGADFSTTTERGGTYHLHAPAGTHTLVVSYLGLDTESVSVSVQAGATVQRDFALTSGIYKMNPFTVAGEREGNALALTIQRDSQGVKNVVSADAFGALAGNPADLLFRLPGIEGTSTSGDTRYIRIRGLHQALSTVTVDGNRVAAANGAGTDRVMEFQPTGADAIERIEVVKSPTPDMDGDSIGGAVNMVSKSAFDRSPERRIAASVGGIWRPLTTIRDPIHESYTFSYSEVFGGKLGVAFNFASRVHGTPEDLTTRGYQTLANGVPGPRFTNSYQFENLQQYDRSGMGGGLKLDYKFSDNTRFSFNTTLNRYGEHAYTHGFVTSTAASLATVDANGNPTGGGGVLPGYTDSVSNWRANYTVPGTGALVISPTAMNTWMRTTERRNSVAQNTLTGEHKYEGLLIDWNLYESKAKSDYPGNKRLDLYLRGIGMRIERTDEPYYPKVTQTTGPDISQINNYNSTLNNLVNNQYAINLRKTAWDKYRGATLNLKKEFETVAPTYLKAGLRFRGQTRDGNNTAYRGNYVGPDGVMGINPATGVSDDNLAQFVLPLTDKSLSSSDHFARYPLLPYPRRMALEGGGPAGYSNDRSYNIDTAFQRNRQLFKDDILFNAQSNLEGFTHFGEDISAYYIQGHVKLGKLGILGGVRVEETKTVGRGTGQTITPAERARRTAYDTQFGAPNYLTANAAGLAEILRRTTAQFGTMAETRGQYRDVLPGLHFKYQPLPRLITRLSYATNIGRPDLGNIISRTTANDLSLTVSANNPSLKPQTSSNFDLSAEYYLNPAGIVSAGVFMKELKNFIFTQSGAVIASGADNGYNGEYAGYTLTTKVNGGFAKIKGLELNFTQQFTFLPGWWGGFSAYANYTRLQAEGNYSAGNSIAVAPTAQVAGFTPKGANLGISYVRNKISIRTQFNHRSRYLVSYNPTQSLLTYAKARNVVDLKTGYQISKRYDVYLNIDNVLNEADVAQELYGGYSTTFIKISPLFHFGINARF
jgi:iron complex outermembrane receptor protein